MTDNHAPPIVRGAFLSVEHTSPLSLRIIVLTCNGRSIWRGRKLPSGKLKYSPTIRDDFSDLWLHTLSRASNVEAADKSSSDSGDFRDNTPREGVGAGEFSRLQLRAHSEYDTITPCIPYCTVYYLDDSYERVFQAHHHPRPWLNSRTHIISWNDWPSQDSPRILAFSSYHITYCTNQIKKIFLIRSNAVINDVHLRQKFESGN